MVFETWIVSNSKLTMAVLQWLMERSVLLSGLNGITAHLKLESNRFQTVKTVCEVPSGLAGLEAKAVSVLSRYGFVVCDAPVCRSRSGLIGYRKRELPCRSPLVADEISSQHLALRVANSGTSTAPMTLAGSCKDGGRRKS